MKDEGRVSLLYPKGEAGYKTVSETTMHDLGMDAFCCQLTDNKTEQAVIMQVLSKMTADPHTAKYRSDIFDEIYKNPQMCEKMMELLGKIDFLKDYGVFKKNYESSAGIWDLMHRLEEMNEYIGYVEATHECLLEAEPVSEGLKALKERIDKVYHDNGYDALKRDISRLKASTENLKSITLGINLNERFEAESMGLISINNKQFVRSGIIGEFYEKIAAKDHIQEGTDWDENYKYHQIKPDALTDNAGLAKTALVTSGMKSPLLASQIASIPSGDGAEYSTRYMNREANHLISITVKNLRETLHKYMSVTITEVTDLIPELMFYVRFADYIRKLADKGIKFSKPEVIEKADFGYEMHAKGVYNLKLIPGSLLTGEEIVPNDLDFDKDSMIYILTGANRGGKTTITQTVGQIFMLAQSGIYIPGESFDYEPVDCIYTHFPADEDKTMDLGRLGEECKRFRELYRDAGNKSLILLNETFSTTSFEEGYYIARDSVKAIAKKGIRTIYNTHMHKLAMEITSESGEREREGIKSLIIRSEDEEDRFKVVVAPPEGMSYAKRIAERYGVTYESLTDGE